MPLDTKFHRDKHNSNLFSGTARNLNSIFPPQSALAASAWLRDSGTYMQQSGRLPLLYGQIPGLYCSLVPSGGTSATGSSNHWAIVMVNTPNAHVIGISPDYYSALSASSWTPSARTYTAAYS